MKILLLILGLAGIGYCGDAAFDGADLGGLYDGNFLHGGYGGDFKNIQDIGDGFEVEPPPLAPPLDVGYDEATPQHHFRGLGQLPRHSFPRPRPPVDQGYGYGPSRHPAFYDDIDTGRPLIKPIVPVVVKKAVAKPFNFPRTVFRHEVPVGGSPIYKPGVVSAPIVKEVGHSHLGGYGKSYPGHGYAQLVGGIGDIHHHHLANVHQYLDPRPSIYKPVVPLYKPTPFSIQPSLSYGYSYKLVPTYAYGPAILADHAGIGYAHGYGHHGPAQAHY